MAIDAPGYLLPAGDAYTDDFQCLMVFVPNKDEYRRALWGSLDYLGTWLAWERDDQKRGKDAARAWKEATELSRECFTMATCDEILALLTKIERNTRACCGESTYVSYQENTVVTTVIAPGVGPAPATYGETPVADWDEWKEYVCYHAHEYVDDLIETAEKIDQALSVGGYMLDFIAHLFSLVQWRMVEDIVPVDFSVVQAIFDSLGQGLIQNEFNQAALDFETYREDIVCAIMLGTDLETEIQSIVGTGLIWDAYYKWLDYETTVAIIYEGQLPGVAYLTPVKRSDCECVPSLPAGASTWPLKITALSYTPDDATWTTVVNSWDANGFDLTVTHNSTSGHYYYVYLDISASPYYPEGDHRGIAYDGLRMDYPQSLGISPCGTGLQDQCGTTAGYDNQNNWHMVYSSPYAGFDSDIEAYLGVTFAGVNSTNGLTQNPDQTRTLVLRFWFKDINQGYTSNLRLNGMHWAINKV